MLSSPPAVSAEESALGLRYGQRFSIVEREDLRVYEDGSYRGFLYREKRGYFRAELSGSVDETSAGASSPAAERYEGEVYVVGEMKREAKLQEKPVDEVHEVAFLLRRNGLLQVRRGNYPLRKGFPRFPEEEVAPGESWRAEGEERFLGDEQSLVSAPFNCRYTYRGRDVYMERPVQVVEFEYVFGGSRSDRSSSGELRGRVNGSLLIFTDERGGYFVRERIERRRSEGGAQLRETGFRLTWSTGISPARIDTLEQRIVRALEGAGDTPSAGAGDDNRAAGEGDGETTPAAGETAAGGGTASASGSGGEDGDEGASAGGGSAGGKTAEEEEKEAGEGAEAAGGIAVERREEGLVLNLPDIHFVPDQATVLPDERERLDRLAELLELAPDSSFLVKGHTADVGTEKSQYELSVERAKTIIEEMGRRGIPEKNFLYRGMGGTEPVASNETEAGRAQNRRVEVIILDG